MENGRTAKQSHGGPDRACEPTKRSHSSRFLHRFCLLPIMDSSRRVRTSRRAPVERNEAILHPTFTVSGIERLFGEPRIGRWDFADRPSPTYVRRGVSVQ